MAEINIIKIDGKPLEKLFDVISKGIGTIYRPRSIKKEAEAEVYRIEIIERAKVAAKLESLEKEFDFYERIEERITHKEIRRQNNIDNISYIAAEQLSQEQTVSDEPVDEDWATRFFNIAEDVSDEEMQKLWGRILAGEVKQPKSFSLRTLELVKNLSKLEAETFSKVANFTLKTGDEHYIFKGKTEDILSRKFNVQFDDIALLKEIGLIQTGEFTALEFSGKHTGDQVIFTSSNLIIVAKIKANTQTFSMPVFIFTIAGNELIKLINKNTPFEYISEIAKSIRNTNVDVKYGNIISIEGKRVKHTQPLKDFE